MTSEEHQQLINEHVATRHQFDDIVIDSLFGPEDKKLGLHVRDHQKGLVHQMAKMYERIERKGIPSRLTKFDRRLLITGVVGILVEVIKSFT